MKQKLRCMNNLVPTTINPAMRILIRDVCAIKTSKHQVADSLSLFRILLFIVCNAYRRLLKEKINQKKDHK
jgi:hypothetical protein